MVPGSVPNFPADQFSDQLAQLGAYIRDQRLKAQLSLRQLAQLANVSNPYLSQIERGLHEPSVRVLKAIAAGLDLSADVLLAEAGLLERAAGRAAEADAAKRGDGDATERSPAPGAAPGVEAAIDADPRLSAEQKAALVQVYRSYVRATPSG
jgi:transcriptional regulator with XRE-family HTH domain